MALFYILASFCVKFLTMENANLQKFSAHCLKAKPLFMLPRVLQGLAMTPQLRELLARQIAPGSQPRHMPGPLHPESCTDAEQKS